MSSSWSREEYCAGQSPVDASALTAATHQFLSALHLPSIHPFCTGNVKMDDPSIPPMGALGMPERFEGQSTLEVVVTIWYMVAPPLLAMSELWLRLFAGAIAPLGTIYLILLNMNMLKSFQVTTQQQAAKKKKKNKESQTKLSAVVVLTVACAAIIMTDTLYVLENGPLYGAVLFLAATA
ncbi:MAG: hypothetical protein SGARI_006493, partial [Bacillariaceae sp.]